MWLLVDDTRDLNCDVIARTPEAARSILTFMGFKLTCVVLDHDLGTKETGLDVLRYGIESETLPNRVQLCTSNPVGRQNMAAELKAAGYTSTDGGCNWYKKVKDDSADGTEVRLAC